MAPETLFSSADGNSAPAAAADPLLIPTEAQARPGLHVLKEGDLFLVCDAFGDVMAVPLHPDSASQGTEGLFQDDTRIVSRRVVTLAGQRPLLLSSALSADHVLFVADLANPALQDANGQRVAEATLHLRRSQLLWDRRLHEEIRIENFALHPVALPLEMWVEADFRDIFEVRGVTRQHRGTHHPPVAWDHGLQLSYTGRDHRTRRVQIQASQPTTPGQPTSQGPEDGCFRFVISLPPRATTYLLLTIGEPPALLSTTQPPAPLTRCAHRHHAACARNTMRQTMRRGAHITTDNPLFNRWLCQARTDLALLITNLDTGPYPYAGIPWFSTAFGRDAIITAFQRLWLDPALAKGVLRFLAHHQAKETCSFQDSAPGKIMHEIRRGEMAHTGEVPFGAYYGGVDTTPLFVMLAGALFTRTHDRAFAQEIWPAVQLALQWIENHIGLQKEPFLAYERAEASGLQNQGWKDSHDAIFHSDGRSPKPPIALCEVQGYVYGAYRAAATLVRALEGCQGTEQPPPATTWETKAEHLAQRINQRFWLPQRNLYAMALDGDDQPCAVATSNAGHLLFTGVVPPERATAMANQLMSPAFYSGWGIRTVAEGEARYNPMSYHNGSIWPHDVALIAAGFGAYGLNAYAARCLDGLFDAVQGFSNMRLPELLCGFSAKNGMPPTAYPVACLPQAWASGAVYMLLSACLGLSINAERCQIEVTNPMLPPSLPEVVISGLDVGGKAKADVRFSRRSDGAVESHFIRAQGDVTLCLRQARTAQKTGVPTQTGDCSHSPVASVSRQSSATAAACENSTR